MRSGAGCSGVGVAELRCFLACPTGPVPLAARGLEAVLARAGPVGGGGRCAQRQPTRWLRIFAPIQLAGQRSFIPAASDVSCLTDHGATCPDGD
jgi:hypothetical protein